jgi:cysteinyl-tRNA synthetase
MSDDLNISVALAALFDFVRDVNNLLDKNMLSEEEAEKTHKLMMKVDKVLGVIGEISKEEKLSEEAQKLIRKREEARKTKDWKTADEIRQQLKVMGVIVEDTPQGMKWRTEKH